MRNLGLGLTLLGLAGCGSAFTGAAELGLADGGAGVTSLQAGAGGSVGITRPTAGAPSAGEADSAGAAGEAGAARGEEAGVGGSFASAGTSGGGHGGAAGAGGVTCEISETGNRCLPSGGAPSTGGSAGSGPACVPLAACVTDGTIACANWKKSAGGLCGTLANGCGGFITSPVGCLDSEYCSGANRCTEIWGDSCASAYSPGAVCIALPGGREFCPAAPNSASTCVWSPTAEATAGVVGCWLCAGAT